MSEMDTSLRARVRQLLAAGHTRTDVVEIVLEEAPRRWPLWRDFFRPAVAGLVRVVDGELASASNVASRRTLAGVGRRNQDAADRRQLAREYRTANGERVLWDELTLVQIQLKIAQLRKIVGGLVEHIAVLFAAERLCVDRGVGRLGDVGDNWPELIRKTVAAQTADIAEVETALERLADGASAGVVKPPRRTARKPVTSTNPPASPGGNDPQTRAA